jgi:very-short-patch-repair endonuclease
LGEYGADIVIESKKVLIEYDGIQHFEDKGFTHSSLEEIQFHDNLKNNYCNTHGIKMIRIPYWEIENINSILNKNILINLHEDIV